MAATDLLAWAVFVGTTAAGVTTATRALPPVQRWMFARVRPWACDVCMGFWTVGLVSLGMAVWQHDAALLLACGPAYPWALVVLYKTGEPKSPPPMPPLL